MSPVTAPVPGFRYTTNGRRPSYYLFSAAVHAALLAAVAFGPRPAPRVKRPIYESIIRPNERKIIWYRKVPEISPAVKVGDSKEPQGTIKSPTTTIAMSPKPESSKQIVLQPAPKIKLEQDLAAPNLVAVAAPLLPPPPAPKAVKRFVAPPAPSKPKPAIPVLEEPDVTVSWTDPSGAEKSLSYMRPKRTFIAPPRQQASTAAPRLTLESAPELGSEGATQAAKLPGAGYGLPGKPAPKRFSPPSGANMAGTGAPGGGGAGGNGVALDAPPPELPGGGSSLSAAIVGLNPSDKLIGSIPNGSRAGEFSAAPKVGKPSTGDVNGAAVAVLPGVVVKGAKDERAKSDGGVNPPSVGSRTVKYDDLVSDSLRPALSAPLRPSSRTIPRALEARFQGRLVYTIVIPAANLPAYTGDWIVWFAEPGKAPGDSPRMRAPIPLQKTEPVVAGLASVANRSETRIQLAAVIKSNGHVDGVTLVRGPGTAATQSAMEDLKRWEFRPAMRDGAPIDVEVVIEIPFSSAWLSL